MVDWVRHGDPAGVSASGVEIGAGMRCAAGIGGV